MSISQLIPDLVTHCLAVTENAPWPMVTVEGHTRIVRYGNPAFCSLLGQPLDHLIGQPIDQLLQANSPCVEMLDQVFRTQKPASYTDLETFHSKTIFRSYTIWPVHEHEDLVGLMIQMTDLEQADCHAVAMNEALLLDSKRQHVLVDAAETLNAQLRLEIAERKQAEQALRKNEWLLRYATESARLTYVEIDFAHGGVRTADNFEAVMGYPSPPTDVTAGSWLLMEHVVPADRSRVKASFQEFLVSTPTGKIQYRVRGDDGVERWIESRWTLEFDPQGRPLKSFATNLNITDTKQAEDALRRSEEQVRLALDAAELGTFNQDALTHSFTTDSRLRTLFGLTLNTPTIEHCFETIHADDQGPVREAAAAVLQRHDTAPNEIEFRVVHPDGSLHWVYAKGRAHFGAEPPREKLLSFDGTVADITQHKRTEAALRESEERYRSIFTTVDEGFCIVEVLFDEVGHPYDHLILEANLAFEKHSGLPNPIGKKASELAPQLDQEWNDVYGEVIRTGQSVRLERESKALGRWFDVFVTRVGSATDRKVAIAFTNITTRKTAEAALRRSEARFQALITQATAGIAEMDINGNFTLVNERYCILAGRTADDLMGRSCLDLVHPDDRAACLRNAEVLRKNRTSFSMEKRMLRPDGMSVWVSISVAAITRPDQVLLGFVEIAQDISDQKHLELELQASETYFRELTQNLPIGVWTSQPDGTIDFINRHWTDYTGQKLGPSLIHPDAWVDCLHPDDRERVEQAAANGHSREGYIVEARFRRAQTSDYRWFLKRSIPVLDTEGYLKKRIVVCVDIDDLKRSQNDLVDHAGELAQQVNERTSELRETIGELEAFSYSVSHDMRAPLRALQGFSLLLLHKHASALDAESLDYLHRINASASRMDALISDVLTYSRLLRSEIVLTPVNLDNLVRQVIFIYPQLQANGAQIKIEGTLPTVLAHEASLTQCISNLLSNAVKFVPRGRTAEVRVYADEINGDARLWIADNGIGIAPEDHQRIWAIFTRIGRAKDYEGTGIGLAIVRKSLERMSGSITLESALGEGSKFALRLRKA